MAQWLSALHAARTNQDRQQDSEALAARLVASDALGLLDPDLQRLAKRQAAAYQQRQASGGLQAIEPQSADGPTAVSTAPPPQSAPGNVAEDESVKRVAPQSTMPLRIPGGIADGWGAYRLNANLELEHHTRPPVRRGSIAAGNGYVRAYRRLKELADQQVASGIELSLPVRLEERAA